MVNKSITHEEKFLKGNSLIDLGYRDYIAARFLLNNRLIIQGLTLASTSIEKYWKSLIVFNSKEREGYYYHFDKLEKLKTLLSKNTPDLLEKFDPVFLEVLENAFKIRYYDKINEPIFIGIYLNQFIGELDYTIDLLQKFIVQTKYGDTSMMAYTRAVKNNDPHLYENNFILNNQSKKDFMETPDHGFSIHIYVGGAVQSEKIVKGENIVNKYEGRITRFTEFQSQFFNIKTPLDNLRKNTAME
jgi:hypothetical protein